MKLYKLNYKENLNNPEANPWDIQDLILGDLNLIVGENSSGKSRTIRVINNFAKIISMPTTKPLDGEFYFEFVYDKDKKFVYECKVEHQKVAKELITVDEERKLERDASRTSLYSETEKNYINIHPPIDKLVLHVRRDKKEYPFLETLIGWANNTQGFYFGNTHPDYIEIPKEMEKLESLNVVPSVLEQMKPSNIQSVIKDFKKIGYFIESARADIFPGLLPNIKMISLKEKGLKFNILIRSIVKPRHALSEPCRT